MPDNDSSLISGKSVLVTGGAGFIGSHLVDRLIPENPKRIVVVDSLFLGKLSNLAAAQKESKSIEILVRDASIFPVLEEIVKTREIDLVFDLATIPLPTSYVQPRWTYENNIRIVLNWCELLRQEKFGLYVHASSSEALGTAISLPMPEDHPMNPTTTYGSSKASQDLLIQSYDRMYGLNYLIFRPFNNFGERQNEKAYAGVIPSTIQRILGGEPPVLFGDGEQTRDFIYVKDTVDAVVRLVKNSECRNQIVHVARGREIRVIDLIQTICRIMGYNGEIKKFPPRPNDVSRHFADTRRLRSYIEFHPIDLENGIEHVIEWYRTEAEK
jgi:UDP-glucose 4-epimerase